MRRSHCAIPRARGTTFERHERPSARGSSRTSLLVPREEGRRFFCDFELLGKTLILPAQPLELLAGTLGFARRRSFPSLVNLVVQRLVRHAELARYLGDSAPLARLNRSLPKLLRTLPHVDILSFRGVHRFRTDPNRNRKRNRNR